MTFVLPMVDPTAGTLDGNQTTIVVAIITVMGVFAAAFAPAVVKKIRTRTDARDDGVAENATLKSAAEVAMDLVESTKGWADHLIQAMQLQITQLKQRITQLEADLDDARATIALLRSNEMNYSADIQRLEIRMAELQVARNAAVAQVAKLQALVTEGTARSAELVLDPETIKQHRDTHTGPTPIIA